MKSVKEEIQKLKGSGLYSSINEDGEKVAVFFQEGVGADVKTYQKNGWVRVDEYDVDGDRIGETYEGRWIDKVGGM